MMKSLSAFCVSCACLLLLATSSFANVIPIDLNDFFADPSDAVVIAEDGSYAKLNENENFLTYLANDPLLGDDGLVVPENVLSLEFCLNFSLAEGNEDLFYAILFDGETGDPIPSDSSFYSLDYGSIDVTDTFYGVLSWDLSELDPGITLLGLEFVLETYDDLFASTASISNPVFVTAGSAPVPEPGTFLLLSAGLAGLVVYRRKG
jgi:hypothetical protein